MALAPASMVIAIDSSVLPPVAIIATWSEISLILFTISEVLSAPETLKISIPALILPLISSLSETMVMVTGISIYSLSLWIKSLGVGLLSTTPKAPWNSAWMANSTDLSPVVIPPPTPQKIGLSAANIKALEIVGCGVKGYTAIMALALVLRIMATSVLKRKDFNNCPKTRIPEQSCIISGTVTIFLRSLLPKEGMCFKLKCFDHNYAQMYSNRPYDLKNCDFINSCI